MTAPFTARGGGFYHHPPLTRAAPSTSSSHSLRCSSENLFCGPNFLFCTSASPFWNPENLFCGADFIRRWHEIARCAPDLPSAIRMWLHTPDRPSPVVSR